VKARKEAQGVKEQVSAETLKLQRSVQQLAAARDVSQLEHQLAQSDIEATHARIESGAAGLKDEQNAMVAEHQSYTAYLNSSFQLTGTDPASAPDWPVGRLGPGTPRR